MRGAAGQIHQFQVPYKYHGHRDFELSAGDRRSIVRMVAERIGGDVK
ncbi:MAG: hypothetical protein ACYCZN_04610 [Candidatus Dormibacteria bacterium]